MIDNHFVGMTRKDLGTQAIILLQKLTNPRVTNGEREYVEQSVEKLLEAWKLRQREAD